ncbi:MAG: biopolymer transporter ExbD [Alphaproteobacteria bacterium]|nr:biopolymer transporter ExbD [Alphaproteobacteria bacterium]
MAMELGGGEHDGLGHGYGPGPMAQINVTPLVDVMLVLLIVFIIAAPLMAAGVQVNLPKAAAKQVETKKTTVVVSIDQEGRVFVERDQVEPERLVPYLADRLAGGGKDDPVFVKADKAVPYGRVLQIVGLIGASGVGRVSLLADQLPPPAPAP